MTQQNGRYYSLNHFLRQRHHDKVVKLSIDGGFTCPNRDGTLSYDGCIFCSNRGSGDFTPSSHLSIYEQLEKAHLLIKDKWKNSCKYIAYFQSYTNTYGPVSYIREKFEQALSFPGLVGIAVATRPDCLPDPVLDYLEDLSRRTHLWVELGLQTIHPESAKWMNRGYTLECFEQALHQLNSRNIETVAHLILGLPGESKEDMLATARYVARLPLQGVKLHMLYVVDNSPLGAYYMKNPFQLLTEDEYVYMVGEILKVLPKNFVIHRLTGDGDKNHLLAPEWNINKKHILNHIHHYLDEHNIYQGQNFY